MATINLSHVKYQFGAGTPAQALAIGDTLNLFEAGALLASGTGAAAGIQAAGANTINIYGTVYSDEYYAIHSTAGNNSISIAPTGSISGSSGGIYLAAGGNSIGNSGGIVGGSAYGIYIANGLNAINNTGSIHSASSAIVTLGTGNTIWNSGFIEAQGNITTTAVILGGNSTIVNTGSIYGGYGISVIEGTNSLYNSGTIIGAFGVAFGGGTGQDNVTNDGYMQAAGSVAVDLDDGNDFYDGRNGTLVGSVQGGAGSDTLLGGASVDSLEGGADSDYITGGGSGDYIDGGAGFDFARYDFATSGIQARLDNAAFNTGEAAGDTMYNFEGLIGSNFGDILVGNDSGTGNQIYGMAGNDTIYGLAGNDFLTGGAGADSYFTGAGADTVFIQAGDLANGVQDRIFDFTDGQDKLQFSGISTAGVSIIDFSGGTLISIPSSDGGQSTIFLDNISKSAVLNDLLFI